MADTHQLRIEVEVEEDGRILASVPELPGVLAYGATQEEAVRKAKAVALQILADMIESGEEVPDYLLDRALRRPTMPRLDRSAWKFRSGRIRRPTYATRPSSM